MCVGVASGRRWARASFSYVMGSAELAIRVAASCYSKEMDASRANQCQRLAKCIQRRVRLPLRIEPTTHLRYASDLLTDIYLLRGDLQNGYHWPSGPVLSFFFRLYGITFSHCQEEDLHRSSCGKDEERYQKFFYLPRHVKKKKWLCYHGQELKISNSMGQGSVSTSWTNYDAIVMISPPSCVSKSL